MHKAAVRTTWLLTGMLTVVEIWGSDFGFLTLGRDGTQQRMMQKGRKQVLERAKKQYDGSIYESTACWLALLRTAACSSFLKHLAH